MSQLNPSVSVPFLSKTEKTSWRAAQIAVWLVGAVILFCLIFLPAIGTLLFWNILIPVAPALFVLATGLWRNVCPMASTVLLPRHFGWSKQIKLNFKQSGILSLIGTILLLVLVPLRHPIFNNDGPATAILIASLTLVGVVTGFFVEWKSAWCSGLCPIHPVEKLYGSNVALRVPNVHCQSCRNCVVPCPDSTPNNQPLSASPTIFHQISGVFIAGILPGFIWGWFQVPDEQNIAQLNEILQSYFWPFIGGAFSLILFLVIGYFTPKKEAKLVKAFAAAAVSCYYWFRIPMLFGFGGQQNDGLLINLTAYLPAWLITATTILTTLFFFYWILFRKANKKSWLARPPFAVNQA